MRGQFPRTLESKIQSPSSVRVLLRSRASKKIVFTNGCFDLLHKGHVRYLEQARQQGALLIVALNTDASVRRLKGKSRPINSLQDRMEIIAALECVDFVTWFDEDKPLKLIELLRPNIYVKGSDWKLKDLEEVPLIRSWGGRVKLIRFVEKRSTTGLIRKIHGKGG